MKNYFFLLAFLIISNVVIAQNNYQPGYYIKNNHDTVYCLIDYRGDQRNAKFCSVKEDESSSSIQLGPTDIVAYRFVDGKYYVSKTIKEGNSTKTVFLEYLVNGIVDLFFYKDQFGEFNYFVESDTGELLRLTNKTNKVLIGEREKLRKKDLRYIGQLKVFLKDSPEIQSQLNKAKLRHSSLIKIASDYHNYVCDTEECIVYEKQKPILKFKFAPYISLGQSKLKFTNPNPTTYTKLNINHDIYSAFGIQSKISVPNFNEKISIIVGAEIGKQYFSAFYKEILSSFRYELTDLKLCTKNLRTSLSIDYTYPTGIFRPTIAVGVMYQNTFSVDSETITENVYSDIGSKSSSTNIPLASAYWGGLVKIGGNIQLSKYINMFFNMQYSYVTGGTEYDGLNTQDVIEYKFTTSHLHTLCLNVGIYL